MFKLLHSKLDENPVMKKPKYPLVVAIVKPSEYNGRVMRGTALKFCKARETAKSFFIEFTESHEKKYPKLLEKSEHGRLSECERGTEKLNVGFSKSYIFDSHCEYVQKIKNALIEKKLNNFNGQPIV